MLSCILGKCSYENQHYPRALHHANRGQPDQAFLTEPDQKHPRLGVANNSPLQACSKHAMRCSAMTRLPDTFSHHGIHPEATGCTTSLNSRPCGGHKKRQMAGSSLGNKACSCARPAAVTSANNPHVTFQVFARPCLHTLPVTAAGNNSQCRGQVHCTKGW